MLLPIAMGTGKCGGAGTVAIGIVLINGFMGCEFCVFYDGFI